MTEFSVSGQSVVVVGGGRSGVAAAELLVSRGARVTLTDRSSNLDAETRLCAAGVRLELGGHDEATLRAADLIVVSPGVAFDQPAIAAARHAGVPVIGELELAFRWLRGDVVAITGTKGKSTTATLAGRMLNAGGFRAFVAGNIGTPLSTHVSMSAADVIHVVEVSSFQLESVDTFHPWVAVLLNLSPDHLDRHGSIEAYTAAKARIFAGQDEHDWSVVNADDPQALALARGSRASRLSFAVDTPLDDGIVIAGDAIVRRTRSGDKQLVPLSAVRLLGRHLLSDVLAAAAVGTIAGVSTEAMTRAVETFTGLEHVLEFVAVVDGVRFVNDSKATNIEAACRAIESFGAGVVVILGGRFKGGDFRDLRVPLANRRASVVALGEARPLIREALGDAVTIYDAESMAAAVRKAMEVAVPGGTVLLAPACASFDMFRDYAERGMVFRREVAKLCDERRGKREQ